MNEKEDRPLPGVHVGAKRPENSPWSPKVSTYLSRQNPSIEEFAAILHEHITEATTTRHWDETQRWLASSYIDAIMFKDGEPPNGINQSVVNTVDYFYFVLRRKLQLKGFQEPFQLSVKQLTGKLKRTIRNAANKKGWNDKEKGLAIAYGISLIKKNARRPTGLDQYMVEVVRRRFTLCYMLMEADLKDQPPLPGTEGPWFQQVYEATKPYVEHLWGSNKGEGGSAVLS